MTVKELYDWALKKGYENFEIISTSYYGSDPFNPDSEFQVVKGKLILECEC